jgi:predicted dehydrogenase
MKHVANLRAAIVGCGAIAQWHHLPVWTRLAGIDVVALCDRDERLASELAGRYRIGAWYTDFSRMLASEGPDIVDVCTPPGVHAALSVEALEAGCHVLIEKPMALNLQEFEQIVGPAHRSGMKICQVHHMLFEPVMVKARNMVRHGAIGEFLGVDVRSSSHRDGELLRDRTHWVHRLPAGILSESLAHPLYIAAAFAGSVSPVAIHAGRPGIDGVSAAKEVRIVLKGERGMGGISYSCSNAPKDKLIVDVYGTKGNLRIDLWNSSLVKYGAGGESRSGRAFENLGQAFSIVGNSLLTTLSVVTGRFHTGHYTLIKRVLESVQNDTEPPVTIEEARNVIEVLEKVARSLHGAA